jgi:hypothetical protein
VKYFCGMFLVLYFVLMLMQVVSPDSPRVQVRGFKPIPGMNRENSLNLLTGGFPFLFMKNCGQMDDAVIFYCRASDKSVYFTGDGVVFDFDSTLQEKAADENYSNRYISLKFLDANPELIVEGNVKANVNINYFKGNNPSGWFQEIPAYSEITYRDIYDHIDLRFYEFSGTLRYDFIVNPGGDVNDIRLAVNHDAQIKEINKELIIQSESLELTQCAPYIFQNVNVDIHTVAGEYKLRNEREFGFCVAGYNHDYPLIIDPALAFSTYLGGSGNDYGYGVAVDSSGYIYLAGYTSSTDFPLKDRYQGSNRGDRDVFVTKLSPSGNSIIYSTYIGGSDTDKARGLAIDSSGCVYVTGFTNSSNFPTINAYQSGRSGSSYDVFITKLSASGSNLVYSTYLGGSGDDFGYGIAIDASSRAYITGETASTNFPVSNAYHGSSGGDIDAIVAKLSADGGSLLYSTYLGGQATDSGQGIAVDPAGNIYITGYTDSIDFPVHNPLQQNSGGNRDAFVARISASGDSLFYSTYYGGSSGDGGFGIAIDSSGCAYITGFTLSSNLPTMNSVYNSYGGSRDGFIAKLSASGNSLVYATFLGGSSEEQCLTIALNSSNCAVVAGYTYSLNFPVKDHVQESLSAESDAFVAMVNAAGNSLVYSTFLGGDGEDEIYSVFFDSTGSAFVMGSTASSDFPVLNYYRMSSSGGRDVFLAKLSAPVIPGVTVSPNSGLITTESGGTTNFIVVLNTQPSTNVAISLTSSNIGEGTVSPAFLTFNVGNWNSPQMVTVTGVDDFSVDGNIAYTIITGAAVSTDPNYNGINPADVTVVNTDNDIAGITVNPVTGLVTTEGGGTAAFTIALNSKPTSNVTINLSSSNVFEGNISPSAVIFTADNWNISQSVIVTGVDDYQVDGNVDYQIIIAPAVSGDSNYNGINAADVSLLNMDNDVAGITITPVLGLTTTESGGKSSFTVVLNTIPSSIVTVNCNSDDATEGAVSPSSVTFTSANWNTPQTLTVTGLDDDIVDGNITYHIITSPAVSLDSNYSGINPADVTVVNTDNDVAGITINPVTGLFTTEGGGAATFSIVLNTQPAANVVINLNSDDTSEGTITPNSITFTGVNWNIPQVVTITGCDDVVVDGPVTYHIITSPSVSTDLSYNGMNAADITVVNNDNDAIIPSPTGSGAVNFSTSNGILSNLTAVAVPSCGSMKNFSFPHGLFSYTVTGIVPGSVTMVTLTLPSNMAAGTQFWKCQNNQWVNLTSLLGDDDGDNILTLTIRDGGLGDADGLANGVIVDPGGPVQVSNSASTTNSVNNAANAVSGDSRRPKDSNSVSPQLPESIVKVPARVSVKYLNVQPVQAKVSQPVTISANMVNNGDESGSYTATLKLNGTIQEIKTGKIGVHAAVPIQFIVSPHTPGSYTIDLNGQQSGFVVVAGNNANDNLQNQRILIIILFSMICMVIGLVLLVISRRMGRI